MSDEVKYGIPMIPPQEDYIPPKELFPVCRSISRMSNVYSLKLLYAINHLFDGSNYTITFRKSQLQVYFGLNEINDGEKSLEELIHGALLAILGQPIYEELVIDDHLSREFRAVPWLHHYKLDTNEETVEIVLNNLISPYLSCLDVFTYFKFDYYDSLSLTYPIWLYAALSYALKDKEYWYLPMPLLSELLHFGDRLLYQSSPLHKRTATMLKSLGIVLSHQAKQENGLAYREGRPPRFVPWMWLQGNRWTKDPYVGPMSTLRLRSSFWVNICLLKQGNSYTHMVFCSDPELSNGVPSRVVEDSHKPTLQEILPLLTTK